MSRSIAPSIVPIGAGGITTARGFRAAGVSAGIKSSGALDFALLVADDAASAAAVFTTNRVVAAPVVVSREHLTRSHGNGRAIVINSGCANACTGDPGLKVARDTAVRAAQLLSCPAEQVLVASTGVIGVALPLERIEGGLSQALRVLGPDQGATAARAIMTTDPFPKEAAACVRIAGREIFVGGMAKGAGMIEPMMATMLGFITTDAAVPPPLLDRALRTAVKDTFNAITVDGECSTNDCVMVLASGAGGAAVSDGEESEYSDFVAALTAVCRELALGIVRGGEGATKLVRVKIAGAASEAEARTCAKAIANSLLVKTAIHGGDPNWGRLLAVAGRAGVAFDLSRARVTIGPVVLFSDGGPHDERAGEAADYLKGKDLTVCVDLGAGACASTVWTCDLSAEYVRINADYRT